MLLSILVIVWCAACVRGLSELLSKYVMLGGRVKSVCWLVSGFVVFRVVV